MDPRLIPGDAAPDFVLYDKDSNRVQLSGFRGQKLILFFYPSAETPGCTVEACDFRDNEHIFTALGYKVIGISSDNTLKVKHWAEKRNLQYTLLLDPDKAVHRSFGINRWSSPISMITGGRSRSTFVIDQDGKIDVALYNVQAFGHVKALRSLLESRMVAA
jgi:peroxiredoxin Q/BCP